MPVASLMAFTVELGTTAPLASRITPTRAPLVVWAWPKPALTKERTIRTTANANFLTNMYWTPRKGCVLREVPRRSRANILTGKCNAGWYQISEYEISTVVRKFRQL